FIPGKIFRVPEFNTVNVHFSLLPELRGAAPYQRAIEMGLKRTGITIFEIAAEMDAGDIWSRKEVPILPDDTSESLSERMGKEGAPFLTDTLESIIKGDIKKEPQDNSHATFAKVVSKEEGRIVWNFIAGEIYNKFRAFYPWPGVSFSSGDKKITIKSMNISGEKSELSPGTILSLTKEGLKVCCGKGSVVNIYSILPQGKKEMTPYTFSLGNRIPEKLD
ncbi:MAG: methionyl-tRNA formyltransferase, partial [Candidatus Aminicenantes bacterium]|nr:methionyl-tRNA formyltransferase [Candidatus Aminicenantes bacterium]